MGGAGKPRSSEGGTTKAPPRGTTPAFSCGTPWSATQRPLLRDPPTRRGRGMGFRSTPLWLTTGVHTSACRSRATALCSAGY